MIVVIIVSICLPNDIVQCDTMSIVFDTFSQSQPYAIPGTGEVHTIPH